MHTARRESFQGALKIGERLAHVVVAPEGDAGPADFAHDAAPQHVVQVEHHQPPGSPGDALERRANVRGRVLDHSRGERRFRRVPELLRPTARPGRCEPAPGVEDEYRRVIAQRIGQREVHSREQLRLADPWAVVEHPQSAFKWRRHPNRHEHRAGPGGKLSDRRCVSPHLVEGPVQVDLVARQRAAERLDRGLGPRPDDGRPVGARRSGRQRGHDRSRRRQRRFGVGQRRVRDVPRQRLDVEIRDEIQAL